jgi:hypothetical protein
MGWDWDLFLKSTIAVFLVSNAIINLWVLVDQHQQKVLKANWEGAHNSVKRLEGLLDLSNDRYVAAEKVYHNNLDALLAQVDVLKKEKNKMLTDQIESEVAKIGYDIRINKPKKRSVKVKNES